MAGTGARTSGGESRRRGRGSRNRSGGGAVRSAGALCRKELVRDDGERDVVVQPCPGPPFVVIEPEDAFAFLIIALDAPAQSRVPDESNERRVGRQVGEPRLGRRGFAFG